MIIKFNGIGRELLAIYTYLHSNELCISCVKLKVDDVDDDDGTERKKNRAEVNKFEFTIDSEHDFAAEQKISE